jgi:hypothetical protein
VPIEQTNTFTARAQVENYRGLGRPYDFTQATTATVLETGPSLQTFTFAGTCAGGTPIWQPVTLRTILSSCVEVQQVCNASSDTVRMDDADSPGRQPPEVLVPGQCTTAYNGPARNLTARSLTFLPTPDTCGAVATTRPPPSFNIGVRIACNRTLPACPLPR